jgi:phage baseplate assembly protein W
MAGMDQNTGGLLDGWDHVGQSVLNLFTTKFFSRVMRPYVGSNAIRILGENINEQSVSRVRVGISVALDLFEPRLVPYRVDLSDFDLTGASSWIMMGIYIPRALEGDMTPSGVRTLTIDPRYLGNALVTTATP